MTTKRCMGNCCHALDPGIVALRKIVGPWQAFCSSSTRSISLRPGATYVVVVQYIKHKKNAFDAIESDKNTTDIA